MNDLSLMGVALVVIATIIAVGKPLIRGFRQGLDPSRQSPSESEEIQELLTRRDRRLNQLFITFLGTGIWLWVFGEREDWNDGAVWYGWTITGYVVAFATILLFYWIRFVIRIGKVRVPGNVASVSSVSNRSGIQKFLTKYQWVGATLIYLSFTIFFSYRFFNTPTGPGPEVISSRVLLSQYHYSAEKKYDPPGTLLTFEIGGGYGGYGNYGGRICGSADYSFGLLEKKTYRIEIQGIEDRWNSYMLSDGPSHGCGKLIRVEEISGAMDEKQVSGNNVSVSGRPPLDYGFAIDIEDSQKKRQSFRFCDDPIGFPTQNDSTLALLSNLVNSGPATFFYNAAEKSAHFDCYALLALRNDSNGNVLESWNVPLLYPATRSALEVSFRPAQSTALSSQPEVGVANSGDATAAASPSVPKTPGNCEAVALRDVHAIQDSSSIIKRGDVDTAITEYTVDKETGVKSFCSHGGYCYPAYATANGEEVESLHLTNCAIDKRSPYEDGGEITYGVVPTR